MSLLKRKEFVLALRLVVGITFLYASMDKVLRPDQFAIAVRSYHILPVSITNLFALVLAWTELISSGLLILGLFTRQAAGALLLMLVMFVVALAAVIARGMAIDCGCFTSDGGASVNFVLIFRNILLIAACLLIMRFDRGWLSLVSRYQPATK
jgi:putative oxidoreductase